jgi:hypothetical protein
MVAQAEKTNTTAKKPTTPVKATIFFIETPP